MASAREHDDALILEATNGRKCSHGESPLTCGDPMCIQRRYLILLEAQRNYQRQAEEWNARRRAFKGQR